MPGLAKTSVPGSRTAAPAEVASGQDSWLIWAGLLLIVAATVCAYSNVLFDFFAGDDFVHLSWLSLAMKHPELIWRNFYTSWLDGTTTKFYRPLISVFMCSDYAVWGTNGLGFHLTNLAFHLTSVLFLYGIVERLCRLSSREPSSESISFARTWALLSAGIFALYPLHPEPVAWITGRVDSVVTTFILASFWCYMRWRDGGRALWLLSSCFAFVLGLLSKEMALTLPAVMMAFEVLVNRQPAAAGTLAWLRVRALACLSTWPYWLLLVAYFGVRRYALGTFVGGYDDSLLFIANWPHFVGSWLHGLRMLIMPLNRELMGAHHILTRAWIVLLVATGVGAAWKVLVRRAYLPLLLFCGVWFALSLLPVYKIFAITDDLQGSRLAYLATVPLSVLLAYGLSTGRRLIWLAYPAATAALVVSALILYANNEPWRLSGVESNAVRQALSKLYKERSGDPQVLMIALPDQVKGAYVCRNALWGMTKYPQLERDINNCLMVNEYEAIFPFGYLKESITELLKKDPNTVSIYSWNSENRDFSVVAPEALTQSDANSLVHWSGPALKTLLTPKPAAGCDFSFAADGSLAIRGSAAPEIVINLPPLPSWTTDFVVVEVALPEAGAFISGAELLYTNELHPEFKLARRVHADATRNAAVGVAAQRLVFPLRALPEWGLGGKTGPAKLVLPAGCRVIVKSVSVVPCKLLAPSISFDGSGYLGSKGYLHVGSKGEPAAVAVNAAALAGAASVELEITRANLLFETQNASVLSKIGGRMLKMPGAAASFRLHKDMFPAPGIYEARAWAMDKDASRIGVASDHIVIAADP